MLDHESTDSLESNGVPESGTSKLADGLSALRHREFRLLWIGTFASNVGSWAQKVATAWLIYHITNSEAWLGIDAFASGIPTVLLLPWGGGAPCAIAGPGGVRQGHIASPRGSRHLGSHRLEIRHPGSCRREIGGKG
jgi:hypothetical protein